MLMTADFTPSGLAPIPGRAWYALRMDTRGMMPQTTARFDAGADRVMFPAQYGLERRGYPTFVPTERWSRRRNRFTRQRVFTTRSLIPGLLLAAVPLGPEANWFAVMASPFVRGVYGALRAVRDRELVGINGMVGEAVKKTADPFGLKAGDKITMPEDAPLSGHSVELIEVLVDVPEPVARGVVAFFGGTVEIEIPIEQLHGVRKDA
jgi:hypothetical protein